MNCNDIERILDDGDVAALGAHERAAVAAHLETCRECALEWEVHAQFVSTEPLAVPESLLARCKAGFVAVARSGGRARSRARPLVLIGLCVGAAAAALVGAGLVDIGGERSRGPSAAPTAAAGSADTPAVSGTGAEAAFGAQTTQTMRAAQGAAEPTPVPADASPESFVLAVSALHADVIDAGARSIAEAIHAELMRQLRALPQMTVVETDFERRGEPIAEIYGAAPEPNAAGSVAVPAVDVRAVDVEAGDGTRTLTLVGGPGVERGADTGTDAEGEGIGSATTSPDSGAVDAFVPEALRARMAAVSGTSAVYGADGSGGAASSVNVVIDRNVRNLNVVSMSTSIGSAASGSDESRASFDLDGTLGVDIDYRLDVEATSVVTDDAVNQWILAIHGIGPAGSRKFDFTASGNSALPVDARATVEGIVESLRRGVLPADSRLLDDLRERALDSRLALGVRMQALEELKQIRERTDVEGRSDDVVRAVAELASAATRSSERERLWQLVRGAKNENLVRPLIDAFLYDANEGVRLEAARTLAADYLDAPSVRAALEQAAYTDESAAIRLQASWAVRDEAARKRYVRDTLLDASLSGDERIAPLLFALREEVVARGPDYASAIAASREQSGFDITSDFADAAVDDSAASALVEILRGIEDESRKLMLVLQLARIPHPALTRFNLETLRGDADERARANAAVALGARVNEPEVRAGLEYARVSDTSPLVREAATRSLSLR